MRHPDIARFGLDASVDARAFERVSMRAIGVSSVIDRLNSLIADFISLMGRIISLFGRLGN
jgi:hypothetical protein